MCSNWKGRRFDDERGFQKGITGIGPFCDEVFERLWIFVRSGATAGGQIRSFRRWVMSLPHGSEGRRPGNVIAQA